MCSGELRERLALRGIKIIDTYSVTETPTVAVGASIIG